MRNKTRILTRNHKTEIRARNSLGKRGKDKKHRAKKSERVKGKELRTQLINIPVGDVIELKREKLKIISRHFKFTKEKMPKNGIAFDRNSKLMHIVVKNVNNDAQRELTGNTIVKIMKGGD